MSNPARTIRIGTMVSASKGQRRQRIGQIADMGFESFEPSSGRRPMARTSPSSESAASTRSKP